MVSRPVVLLKACPELVEGARVEPPLRVPILAFRRGGVCDPPVFLPLRHPGVPGRDPAPWSPRPHPASLVSLSNHTPGNPPRPKPPNLPLRLSLLTSLPSLLALPRPLMRTGRFLTGLLRATNPEPTQPFLVSLPKGISTLPSYPPSALRTQPNPGTVLRPTASSNRLPGIVAAFPQRDADLQAMT